MAPTLKRNPLGVPTFLLGGAFLSTILSSLGQAANRAKSGKLALIMATIGLALLTAALSWLILWGASVARKRIRLALDQPLNALWETVGACGKPPKDGAKQFALMALIMTAAGLLIVIVGLTFALVR